MNTTNDSRHTELEALLRSSLPGTFRPGFAGRVMARLDAEARHDQVKESLLVDIWRNFPRVALAATVLLVGLAAWNVSSREDGALLDRVLSLPACTIGNSLSLWEDWS